MIALGIDPGMKNTGVAVVDLLPRLKADVVFTHTVVDLSTARTYQEVLDIATRFDVDCMCLLVFDTSLRQRNGKPVLMKSSSLTQRTIGAMEIVAHVGMFPCHHYYETEVKLGIAGKQNASKEVVHSSVRAILGWKDRPKGIDGHAMDAIAVCLYHQSMYGLGNKIGGIS